jgi:7-cyano-7-deazaguanine synthase in queuosine biosynthesis
MNTLHLFSGGFDSACLALQRHFEGHKVTGLFFNYGQKTAELDMAACARFTVDFGIPVIMKDIRGIADLFECDYMDKDKETFSAAVPHRSLLFFTLASQFAMTNGYEIVESALWERMDVLKNGFKELTELDRAEFEALKNPYDYDNLLPHTDSCMPFVVAMQQVLKESEPESAVTIQTPYMFRDKLWIWNQYEKMGAFGVGHQQCAYLLQSGTKGAPLGKRLRGLRKLQQSRSQLVALSKGKGTRY